jgi:hypothetical protein
LPDDENRARGVVDHFVDANLLNAALQGRVRVCPEHEDVHTDVLGVADGHVCGLLPDLLVFLPGQVETLVVGRDADRWVGVLRDVVVDVFDGCLLRGESRPTYATEATISPFSWNRGSWTN